jgi:hypothetical protein
MPKNVTKGIHNFHGSIPSAKLDAFRRLWNKLIARDAAKKEI